MKSGPYDVQRKLFDGTWETMGEGYSSPDSAKRACSNARSEWSSSTWRVLYRDMLFVRVVCIGTFIVGRRAIWEQIK